MTNSTEPPIHVTLKFGDPVQCEDIKGIFVKYLHDTNALYVREDGHVYQTHAASLIRVHSTPDTVSQDYKKIFEKGWEETPPSADPMIWAMMKSVAFEWFENGWKAHVQPSPERLLEKLEEARFKMVANSEIEWADGLEQAIAIVREFYAGAAIPPINTGLNSGAATPAPAPASSAYLVKKLEELKGNSGDSEIHILADEVIAALQQGKISHTASGVSAGGSGVGDAADRKDADGGSIGTSFKTSPANDQPVRCSSWEEWWALKPKLPEQNMRQLEPLGDKELKQIEMGCMAWLLQDSEHEASLRLSRILQRLTDSEKKLKAATERQSDWQPIETAPKDGREMLIFQPTGNGELGEKPVIYVCKWDGCWLESQGEIYATFEPTHWMPLPQQPRRGSDE